MRDEEKRLCELGDDLEKKMMELQREYWLGIVEELENRLSRLKREAIKEHEMQRAGKLSICEALANVIKRYVKGGENENEEPND